MAPPPATARKSTVTAPEVVVIELLAADADEFPFAFPAVTLNVYAVEEDNPVIDIGEDEPLPVIEPGVDVAVNVVAVAPKVAGVKATVAVLDPVAVAVPIVGVLGIATEVFPLLNLNELLSKLESVLILLTDIRRFHFQMH